VLFILILGVRARVARTFNFAGTIRVVPNNPPVAHGELS